MELIQHFINKAKLKPVKIVYPEGSDERIILTAARVKTLGIADPIILGNRENIFEIAAANNISLNGIRIIAPEEVSADLEKYAEVYAASREIKIAVAHRMVSKPIAFGGMMVKLGDADGMIAGISTTTASVIQYASLTIGFQEGLTTPSSFFIMVVPEFQGEKDKIFIFADCAVTVSPNARQLAEIGIASGINARALLNIDPKIAFLSFATKGSASHSDVDKVIKAVKFAQAMNPNFKIDGELQADAAIIPRVASKKVKESNVAGEANILIFPDLDAGNISYKLVQYLAKARAYGPILQGFAKPVCDLSRGATVDDIVGVTAITVVQAQNLKKETK